MDNNLENNQLNNGLKLYNAEFNDVCLDFDIELKNYGFGQSKVEHTVVGEYKGHEFCACLIQEVCGRSKVLGEVSYKYRNKLLCSLKTNRDDLPNFTIIGNNENNVGCSIILSAYIYLIFLFPVLFFSSFLAAIPSAYLQNFTNSKEIIFTVFICIMISLVIFFYYLIIKKMNGNKLKFKHKWFQDKYTFNEYINTETLVKFFNSESNCKRIDNAYVKVGQFSIKSNKIQISSNTNLMNPNTIINLLNKSVYCSQMIEDKDF